MQQVAPARQNYEPVVDSASALEETDAMRIRKKEVATKVKDAWLCKKMRERQDEFTQYKQARIFIGTWNVNAKGKDENLESWLCKNWDTGAPPDIVAVGFQEIVDLNAINLVTDRNTLQRSQHWIDKILSTLNSQKRSMDDPVQEYTLLGHEHLVGMMLCVFVRDTHTHKVKYLHTDSVGVGIMGMMGNKGGVSVRLQYYDSTLCFICSHLAAHRNNVTGRNSNYANILSKTSFSVGEEAVRELIHSGAPCQCTTGESNVGISEHDLVFWFGDLNYRIDGSISKEQVLEWSNDGNLEKLRMNDQLDTERKAGRAFDNFQEVNIDFKPTYKYQPGTDVYETRPEKKKRAPAWCDRVLWMSQDPKHVVPLSYETSELNISDHKPVMATFRANVKDIVQSKREAIYEDVMKLMDTEEVRNLLDQEAMDLLETYDLAGNPDEWKYMLLQLTTITVLFVVQYFFGENISIYFGVPRNFPKLLVEFFISVFIVFHLSPYLKRMLS